MHNLEASKNTPFSGCLSVGCIGFNITLTAKVMAVGDAHVFPGFLTPVLT